MGEYQPLVRKLSLRSILKTRELARTTRPLGRGKGYVVGHSKAGWIAVAYCLFFGGGAATASATATATGLAACCADIDARIAELEAAVAEGGGGKVGLTLYGHINQAVMGWDDGYERNATLVTNDASRTRFGFRGTSQISADLSARFLIEIGVRSINSKRSDQISTRSGIDIRRAWWGITSESLGTIQVGRAVTSLEEVTEANLAGTRRGGKYSDVEDSGLGLRLRSASGPSLSDVAWYRLIKHSGNQPGEGDAQSGVRYISPTVAGFFVSASWGADDMWDASVEYLGDISVFKVDARIGYGRSKDSSDAPSIDCMATDVASAPNDADCETMGGSLSVMHRPSGLYGNVAGGWFEDLNVKYAPVFAGLDAESESRFFAFEMGLQRQWFDIGPTTLFGQVYRMEGGANARITVAANDAINSLGIDAGISSSTVRMWSAGVTQDIASVDTKLYAFYRHYEASVMLAGANQIQKSEPIEDLRIVMGGALIKF